ncbi:MAG TPA: DUF929 family protein [Streptosporangiaceae bacterium]|jgi:hypothetical protein
MGKGQARQSARQRIAAQQAAVRQAEARRRWLIGGGAVGVVIVAVVAILLANLLSGKPSQAGRATLPASVQTKLTTVPVSALNAVGAGSVPNYTSRPVTAISGPPLTQDGKPEMLYIGAEFCPYCAAMRWSMAVALSRFGALSGPLQGIHSSANDTDPNTPTLTFYRMAPYTSSYLTFTAVENETETVGQILQPVTPAQKKIWQTYEPGGQTGYPFIDFDNKYVITGPIYDPAVLKGKTWTQVAAALHNPASPIAQGALGAANYITAAICKTTGQQPASVCAAAPVPAIQARL